MITFETVHTNIVRSYQTHKNWGDTAREFGISKGAAFRIGKGLEPGNKVRKMLNLPIAATVVVIGSGKIPDGAQVIRADLCECGQWFVSNHPSRKRCFVCSPYKRKSKK
jgi:hypothetical protein